MPHSFLSIINKQIVSHLIEKNVEPRRDAGPGVWLSTLLPIAIIMGQIKYTTHTAYQVASCISIGMLTHSLLSMVNAYYNRRLQFGAVIISCISSALSLYIFTTEGFILSLIIGFLSIFIYQKILLPVMILCPKSFTYGECTVACQGFILFIFGSAIRNSQTHINCFAIATSILQVGLIGILSISTCAYFFGMKNKVVEFYAFTGVVIFIIVLPSIYILIGQNPVMFILNLFFEDIVSKQLIIFWIFCSIFGVLAVFVQIHSDDKASTIDRKIFHLLTLLVFTPGIIYKPCLMMLSSGAVLALFILLETLRILNMPPIGAGLQSGFLKFADEKDEGPVALTPLYLLIGCALPLWIHPDLSKPELLPLLAGILAIGIGDSAASACGTLVGKNRWPGSKKTKEGTAACFLAQLFAVILLIHLGYVPRTNLLKPTFAVATSSLVEARTDQVDNLVLPLLMYIMLL